MFLTHQAHLPKELALEGMFNMDSVNRYLQHMHLPGLNAEFMQPAQEEGSAFVSWVGGKLEDILCERYEHIGGNDKCAKGSSIAESLVLR
jgi:hypothetical protein